MVTSASGGLLSRCHITVPEVGARSPDTRRRKMRLVLSGRDDLQGVKSNRVVAVRVPHAAGLSELFMATSIVVLLITTSRRR